MVESSVHTANVRAWSAVTGRHDARVSVRETGAEEYGIPGALVGTLL